MEQLFECMDKLKEIQSLVVESIKKMQVICKSLRLARYEQGTPTKVDGGQYATKERNLAINEQEKLRKMVGNANLKIRRPWELHKIKSFHLHAIQACNNF